MRFVTLTALALLGSGPGTTPSPYRDADNDPIKSGGTFTGDLIFNDDIGTYWGTGSDAVCEYDTAQTPDALVCSMSADSLNFILQGIAEKNNDRGHALSSDPTLWLQAAGTTDAEYLSLAHSGSSGVISTGTGGLTLSLSGALTLPANVQIDADYNTAGDLADTTRLYDFLSVVDVNQTLATSDGISNVYSAINWTAGGNGAAILQGIEGVARSQSADEAITLRGGHLRTYIGANADNPGATARTSIGADISARAGYSGGDAVAPEAGTAFVGARIWMAPYFASDYANINNFHGLWVYNEHATQAVTNGIKIGDAGGGFTSDINMQSGDTIANTTTGHLTTSSQLEFGTGVAVAAATYSVGRDADATNQLHFNAPTGAGFEFSINDGAEMTLNATDLDLTANNIKTSGSYLATGGALTLGGVGGATYNETLTCDFENSDAAECTSATGLNRIDFNTIDLETDYLHLLADLASANTIANQIKIERSTSDAGGPLAGIGASVDFYIEDAGGVEVQAGLSASMLDVTDASEDSKIAVSLQQAGAYVTPFEFESADFGPVADDGAALGESGVAWADLYLASGALIDFGAANVTITHASETLTFDGTEGFAFDFSAANEINISTATGVTDFDFGAIDVVTDRFDGLVDAATANDVVDLIVLTRTTSDVGGPAAGIGAGISIALEDAGGSEEQGRLELALTDATDASEDSQWSIKAQSAGAIVTPIMISGIALLPGANDGTAIGASGTAFSDAFFASGAVVNFAAGDVTMTHAADSLSVAGGVFYANGGADIGDLGIANVGNVALDSLSADATNIAINLPGGSLIVDDTGATANSPAISLRGDAAGTELEGAIQLMQGADPYLRFSVDDDSATPALTAAMDLHDTALVFTADNTVDIGAVADNRPKDIHLAGNLFAPTAGKIDFGAANVTITHASETLTFDGTEGLTFDFSGTNIVDVTSATGVLDFDLNTIDLITDYVEATTDPASTNTVVDLLALTRSTTGTPAAGLGAGMQFVLEDLGGPEEQARINAVMTGVTDGAESSKMDFYTQYSGAVTKWFSVGPTSYFFGSVQLPDAIPLSLGSSDDALWSYNTTQAPDTVELEVSTDSRTLAIIERGDGGTNRALAQQTNPTIAIFSANSPASPTSYLRLTHDDTDGVIGTGKGDLSLAPAGLDVVATGKFSSATTAITVDAATTFAATRNVHTLVCTDAESIDTITGGITGMELTIIMLDADCTINNADDGGADTIDLAAAANLTSADDTVLKLVYDGTLWREVSRSVN